MSDVYKIASEKWFELVPEQNITAYELCQILRIFDLHISEGVFANMPDDLQRHFQEKQIH